MKFEYLGAPQRSPEWFKVRIGKVTASRLSDWLAVSKAKTGPGKPLKARLDYEKELMFERQFGVTFETFVSPAMQDGIDFEDFAAKQYEELSNTIALECGCWYNDTFVASPDRTIGDDGLLEIKIVKDNTFTEILMNGVPDKHMKQIQGQLFASGKKWCDYLALNFNTKKFVVINVTPDYEFFDYLELALKEQLVTEPFSIGNVFNIKGQIPESVVLGAALDRSNSNLQGGW